MQAPPWSCAPSRPVRWPGPAPPLRRALSGRSASGTATSGRHAPAANWRPAPTSVHRLRIARSAGRSSSTQAESSAARARASCSPRPSPPHRGPTTRPGHRAARPVRQPPTAPGCGLIPRRADPNLRGCPGAPGRTGLGWTPRLRIVDGHNHALYRHLRSSPNLVALPPQDTVGAEGEWPGVRSRPTYRTNASSWPHRPTARGRRCSARGLTGPACHRPQRTTVRAIVAWPPTRIRCSTPSW